MHVLDFSIDQSRNTAAILIENPTHVAEIFVSSISEPGELRQLTTFNDALFDKLELATPEYMPYSGVDGWPMDGSILKPRDFDASKKYPLIVEIHGGPNTVRLRLHARNADARGGRLRRALYQSAR